MKAVVGFSALVIVMGLMTGCASRGDVDALRSELKTLESRVASVESTANEALNQAKAAHDHASKAESLAQECRKMCEAHSAKMEKMFQKSMMK